MKKIFLSGVVALLLATGTAHGTEILMALMKDAHGEKSIRTMNLKNTTCVSLVNKFTEQAKNGLPVMLTLPEPAFTGQVFMALCIMPSGCIGATFTTTETIDALGIPNVAKRLCKSGV